MVTTATCSRCSWAYVPGERGPIVELYAHHMAEHATEYVVVVRPAPCGEDGCWRPLHAHGLCNTHYQRARRSRDHG